MVKQTIPRQYELMALPEFQRFQKANPGKKIDAVQTMIMYGRAIHWLAIFDILWPDFRGLDYFSIEVKYLVYNDPDRSVYPNELYEQLALTISRCWQIQLEDLFPKGDWSVTIQKDPEMTVDAIIRSSKE